MSDRPRAGRWAVAAPHADATEVAARILAGGGTAVDAALAAAAMLTVAYPHNCALGGDLTAVVSRPGTRATAVLGIGCAGSRADAGPWAGAGQLPITGPATVTVPGLVSGWQALYDLGGSRPWQELVGPAAAAARDGLTVARSVAAALAHESALVLADEGMRSVFAPEGNLLREGDLVRQPALAATLEQLAADPRSFYRGALASRIASALARLDCAVTEEDLRNHRAEVVPALTRSIPGLELEVATCPPPSQGLVLLRILGAAAQLLDRDLLGGAAGELARLFAYAAAERDGWLAHCTPDAGDVEELLSAHSLKALAERASDPSARAPQGQVLPPMKGDTVAVVAIDASGLAVSLIQSLFHSFGSGLLDPATGVIFHNRGCGFRLDPQHPNHLAPGRRPAHTLTPVLARPLEDDATWVVGTMGGRGQAQILTQVLLRLARSAQPTEAIESPRFVVGPLEEGIGGNAVTAEADLAEATMESLRRTEFPVTVVPSRDEEVGHAHAIVATGESVRAAADPRSDGAATQASASATGT